MTAMDKDAVFSDLKAILEGLLGADVVQIVGVSPQSTFVTDLEMDSIQIVAFAEQVNIRYGRKVNFTGWLSKQPLSKLYRLTVGDVAAYVASAS